jgi:hypothetical protein
MLDLFSYFHLLSGKSTEDWEIFVFSDAALGNINSGTGSTGANIIWIKDRKGKCCSICWQANKIKRVEASVTLLL